MSKTGSATKVKLNSFDDLFGTGQQQTGTEQIQEIVLSELHEFKGHPFKVLDDEKMQETVDSNIQREDILPSEKAKAYFMKYEAVKHQGKKGTGSRAGKKTCRPTSRTDFIEGETLRNEGKGVRDTCRKGCSG